MRYLRWPLLVLLICVPLFLLALVFRPSWLAAPRALAEPRPVPQGDQEVAWINTTTNGTTWERFVTGVKRIETLVPGVHIDDSGAFLDQTTAVPEIVIRKDGHEGALRIRWYKISSDVTTTHWIRSLAARNPAPLAVIGGATSDRALELARGLQQQTTWHGDRPLLLLTTATADKAFPSLEVGESGTPEAESYPDLINIYEGRSFRFCFTNDQMAEAVTDFVFADPTLRPGPVAWPGLRMIPLAAGGPWSLIGGIPEFHITPTPHVFTTVWQDDAYSHDLSLQFRLCINQYSGENSGLPISPRFHSASVPFSVGSYYPNRYEADCVDAIVKELPPVGERSLLVIPTSAPPGRRFLRTLCESTPLANRRFVAVTGDSIGMNVIYRDGEFAWPVRALPVPLVMFTHNNPFAWDEAGATAPTGYEFRPPNSTEDALHFTEIGRQLVESIFAMSDEPNDATSRGLVTRADRVALRLRNRGPRFFDELGNRLSDTGEFIVVLRPTFDEDNSTKTPAPDAIIEVYRRAAVGRGWDKVRTLPIVQTQRLAGGMPG